MEQMEEGQNECKECRYQANAIVQVCRCLVSRFDVKSSPLLQQSINQCLPMNVHVIGLAFQPPQWQSAEG